MTNPLSNKNRVLIVSYVHISNLLNFYMNDMVSFDNNNNFFFFFFVFNAYFNTNLWGVWSENIYKNTCR